MIKISRPVIGGEEEHAVLRVLRSRNLSAGKEVLKFEAEFARFIGVKHAIATSSGTAALYISVRSLGIGPGDEVIVPAFTFLASADVILMVGAKPVFIDIDLKTYNIDINRIKSAITPRTKTIIVVHLYGHPAEMKKIVSIAKEHNLKIIEDCAQAHGAMMGSRKVGSFGVGCFSFYATKNMTTGEGGMITTDSDKIASLARLLRSHGYEKNYQQKMLSLNFMMSDIEAAIGRAQLKKLKMLNPKRRRNMSMMNNLIKNNNVIKPIELDGYYHVYHQYTIRTKNRERLQKRLKYAGIETKIYYPLVLSEQLVYKKLGYSSSKFSNALMASREVLSIPIHPALTKKQIHYIADKINRYA